MNKRVFLLGGKDLEMLEIKKILSEKNETYENKDLSWGAKLSDYRNELEKYNSDDITIYGIELEEDIKAPKNYKKIDHHGKNDDKASSLEQIAQILNLELSPKQKLIAANDSRYITGMKNLCATEDEIKEIRKNDRQAQGITFEDEELAKESLEESSKKNTNYIYSKTPKFSAISDLAYYTFDNYVIYDEKKILFYGYKKSNILEFLKEQKIEEHNYYNGGGEFGFVGIKDEVLVNNQINNLLDKFTEYNNKSEIHSYHTFMFPFLFKGDFNENEHWEYKDFKLENVKDYNEYVYFYKHIQDAIYNKELKSNEKWISKYYEYKEQSGTYTINCKKGIFELKLDGISLRVFNTKVAILAFNLKNTKYSDTNSILAINDFGRRIYPQFLGKYYTCDTKNTILSNSITLKTKSINVSEDFTRFDNFNNFKDLEKLNLLPSFIGKLIEKNFSKDDENKTTIRPIIDDRMFVISWYGNNEFSENLRCEKYISDLTWYEYIFVDGDGITVHNKKMQTNLITNATYDRWMDNPWGCTLYGMSRYSFVAVTNESDFARNVILSHMQTMYFQMFTLLLAYRATIIKFSDDIQNTTSKTSEDLKLLSTETKKIYKNYLDFLNKLYFKEITAQDQGIELYNQAMKIMDIEKYMSDLDHEVNQLHTYVDMLEEKERNNKLEFISKIGATLLPPSLLAGLFGMNVLTIDESENNQLLAFTFIIISAILGFLMTTNFKYLKKFSIFKKIFKSIIVAIVPFMFILLILDSFNLLSKFNFSYLKDIVTFEKKFDSNKNSSVEKEKNE